MVKRPDRVRGNKRYRRVRYVQSEGYWVGDLTESAEDPIAAFCEAADVPTPELLRRWRNLCDEVVGTLAGISLGPGSMPLPFGLWCLSQGAQAVMRRSPTPTPSLARLRAAINDVQTTIPEMSAPGLFRAWLRVVPEILSRLRDPIARAREEVDEIEVRGAAPSALLVGALASPATQKARKGDKGARVAEVIAGFLARGVHGATKEQVAEKAGCAPRTVQRSPVWKQYDGARASVRIVGDVETTGGVEASATGGGKRALGQRLAAAKGVREEVEDMSPRRISHRRRSQ